MDTVNLKRMLVQIADYYAAYPDDEAVDGIVGHIRSFWEPRMRTDLLAARDAGECADLPEIALKALEKLQA